MDPGVFAASVTMLDRCLGLQRAFPAGNGVPDQQPCRPADNVCSDFLMLCCACVLAAANGLDSRQGSRAHAILAWLEANPDVAQEPPCHPRTAETLMVRVLDLT